MARRRRVSRQLPKSFVPDNSGQDLIYPPGWKEAFELFAKIAEEEGLNEAHRIFTEVQKRARRAAVRLSNSKPQPINRKHRSHDPERDLEWSSLYYQAIEVQKMTHAAAIRHVCKTASHKPQSEAALDRQVRRLLIPHIRRRLIRQIRRLHPPDK